MILLNNFHRWILKKATQSVSQNTDLGDASLKLVHSHMVRLPMLIPEQVPTEAGKLIDVD